MIQWTALNELTLLGSSSPVFLFQQVSAAHERLWAVELIFHPFYGTSAVVNKSCPSRGYRWLFRLNAICYTANGYWIGLFTKSLLVFHERIISFLYVCMKEAISMIISIPNIGFKLYLFTVLVDSFVACKFKRYVTCIEDNV